MLCAIPGVQVFLFSLCSLIHALSCPVVILGYLPLAKFQHGKYIMNCFVQFVNYVPRSPDKVDNHTWTEIIIQNPFFQNMEGIR